MEERIRPREERDPAKTISKVLFAMIALAVILFIALQFIVTVPAGNRGIVLTWGAVEPRVMNEGLNFKTPIAQSVVMMSVQTQKYSATASSASKDLQDVITEVTLNYRLDPETINKIYQELSYNYEDRVIQPAVQEAVKASTAKFTAEELITKRALAKDEITNSLTEKVERFGGIDIQSISITDFRFSAEFTNAIEAKVTAEQNALKADNDLKRIEIEAQQRVEKAKAEAEAIRIEATALKENAQLIELRQIEMMRDTWNGVMPNVFVTGGSGTNFLLDISKVGGG